jgi:hypothetical protein
MFGIRPLSLELPGYQSLVCWDPRSDANAGVRWLKQQVDRIAGAGP